MTRLAFCLALTLMVGQDVPPEERHLPPGHYCQNHPPRPSERLAHECHCDYQCEQGAGGEWTYHEMANCLVYCHHDRCTCWPEAPCPKPKG